MGELGEGRGCGERAGGGQGKSEPGFAPVFTTYWKCGPGKAAHILGTMLRTFRQTLQEPEEPVFCPPCPAGVMLCVVHAGSMPGSTHWEWK